MKKAKLTVFVFNVKCPYCLEECAEPILDSYQWVIHEHVWGEIHTCSECGQDFELPKIVADNRLDATK